MPLYDYDCTACGRRIEVVHGVHAPGPASCPNCGGGPLRKAIAAPAVHFKGSGWAKRDRRATPAPAASKPGDDGATPDRPRSDGAADAATDSPAASPSPTTTGTGTATKTD